MYVQKSMYITFSSAFFPDMPKLELPTFARYGSAATYWMVGCIIWVSLEIYLDFEQWKNFENPLRIDKVIAMSLVYYFFGTQCSLAWITSLTDDCCGRECRRVLRGSHDHVHHLSDDDSSRTQLSPSQAGHVQDVTIGTVISTMARIYAFAGPDMFLIVCTFDRPFFWLLENCETISYKRINRFCCQLLT